MHIYETSIDDFRPLAQFDHLKRQTETHTVKDTHLKIMPSIFKCIRTK